MAGAGPTTMHVSAITVTTANVGGGNKAGRAIVTVVDNLGNVVSGAVVSVSFTGAFTETRSGTTDAAGSATITTSTTQRGSPSFDACVTLVTHASLTYNPAANAQTCAGR